jgi:hypothetical protein
MATYEKYLNEVLKDFPNWNLDDELTDDDLVSDTLSAEDMYKLKIMAVRAGIPFNLIKRVVSKVYKGIAVTDVKEKPILMDVLKFFLSPDKSKFRTILSKF